MPALTQSPLTAAFVAPYDPDFSWTGPGSGDLESRGLADPINAVPYGEACDVGFPLRRYYPNATTSKNRYVDAVAGNDAWDGTVAVFASGTTGPKKTWKSAYDSLAGTDAVDLDTIILLTGEYNEGEYSPLTKSVRTIPYHLNPAGARAIFDGRPPASAFAWTRDGASDRWWATYTCAHKPEVNEAQASLQSASAGFANQGARWTVTIDSLCALPVTRDGVLLMPAASQSISSLTRAGTTATATTPAPHNLVTGDTVSVYNVDDGANYSPNYNGVFTVTVTGTSTFTYAMPATPTSNGTEENSFGMRWVSKRQVDGTLTYYHDNNADGGAGRIWIGFDPAGHAVRAATVQGFAVWTGGTQVVQGVVWRFYATRYGGVFNGVANPWPKIIHHNSACVYENCFLGFTPADCIGNGTTTTKVYRENHFAWARTGMSSASSAQNLTAERNLGRFMQWFYGSKAGWHCGLLKAANVTNYLVRENKAQFCRGPGIWFDYASGANVIVGNRLDYCNNFGVSLEQNTPAGANRTIVAGNLITNCYWAEGGTGSPQVDTANNTCAHNGVTARLYDDSRSVHNVEIDTITYENEVWITTNDSVLEGQSTINAIGTRDDVTGGVDAVNWISSFDHNILHVEPDVVWTFASNVIGWDQGSTRTSFGYTAWRAAYPTLNPNGRYGATLKERPVLDLDGGDYRPSVAALGVGKTLSAPVAAALGAPYGLAAATAPMAGARWYPGCKPGPTFAVLHEFTGADSAVAVPAAPTGQAGTAHAGTFGLSTNKLYSATDADADHWTLDGGVKNGWIGATVEGTIQSVTNFRFPRLIVAGIDGTSYLYFSVFNNAAYFHKWVSGVQSTLQSAAIGTTANGVQYDLKVRREKNVLIGYVDNIQVLTHTLAATNAAYMDGTLVGMHLAKGGTGGASAARLDTLWVARL